VTRVEAWAQHVANLLVGGTGVVYAWMRYALQPDDPYAIVNHPLERDVQHLHILAAPLLTLLAVWSLPDGVALSVSYLGMELEPVKADALSRMFGTVFAIMAICWPKAESSCAPRMLSWKFKTCRTRYQSPITVRRGVCSASLPHPAPPWQAPHLLAYCFWPWVTSPSTVVAC